MCFFVFLLFFLPLSLAVTVLWQGFRKIPAEPPTYGVKTVFGKRTNTTYREGWHFFFLYPLWESFVPVNMEKKEQDLGPIQVRTPDMAPIEIHVSYTFTPDPENLIEYLNSRKEEGVKAILDDVVDEAIRERVIDKKRRPKTWQQAVGMERELLSEVVANIMGKLPSETGEKDYKQIEDELRIGNGSLVLPKLGVILNRLNVLKVHPMGGVIEAGERLAVETARMKADEVKARNLVARVNQIKSAGFSEEQALEAFQVEQGDKLTKSITESKFNMSHETREFFKEGLSTLGSMIREGFQTIAEAVKDKKGA